MIDMSIFDMTSYQLLEYLSKLNADWKLREDQLSMSSRYGYSSTIIAQIEDKIRLLRSEINFVNTLLLEKFLGGEGQNFMINITRR